MIYLIHFDRPFKHARHYVGWVEGPAGLERRLAQHAAGTGARLLAVVREAGITWRVARTWPDGTRTEERRLKDTRCVPNYCPICRAALRGADQVEHAVIADALAGGA